MSPDGFVVHALHEGRLRRCLYVVLQKSYGEEARLALSRWTLKESMPEDYYLVRDGKLHADRS